MARWLLLLPLFGAAVLAAGCAGGGSPALTPNPDGGATPTIQLSETSGDQPSPSARSADDLVEATTVGTPEAEGSTPAPAGTPLRAGTSTVEPAADVTAAWAECTLNPAASAVDCDELGTFTLDPPLVGDYTDCNLALIQDEPTLLVCSGDERLSPVYYPVQ